MCECIYMYVFIHSFIANTSIAPLQVGLLRGAPNPRTWVHSIFHVPSANAVHFLPMFVLVIIQVYVDNTLLSSDFTCVTRYYDLPRSCVV